MILELDDTLKIREGSIILATRQGLLVREPAQAEVLIIESPTKVKIKFLDTGVVEERSDLTFWSVGLVKF